MYIPVFLVSLFLTTIAEIVPEDREECTDEKNMKFEIELQEIATLQFKVPRRFNGNPGTEFASWTITGPDQWTKCQHKMYKFDHDTIITEKVGSIEKCNYKHMRASSNCILSEVTLSKFESNYAGIWNISREYLDPKIDRMFHKTENHSISIYRTEFDRRYNGTIVQVKEGQYIRIIYHKKKDVNRECKLINRKTNETYDLNTRKHRFSGNRTRIRKIGDCGFRMQIENKSEGLWTLVGEYGYIRQRANFQIYINSSISRKIDYPNKIDERLWIEDFPIRFGEGFESLVPKLSYYLELERPDGNIFSTSDMSQEDFYFNQITKNDEGLWKIREASDDSMILMERNLKVTVDDLPELKYTWKSNRNLSLLLPSNITQIPTCILKNQNGKDFVGKLTREHQFSRSYIQYFLFDALEISNAVSTYGWEFSFDYNHTTINGLIMETKARNKSVSPFTYVWKSVQRIKYVVRGKEIKVKCSVNAPLTNCTLTNPNNVTKYSLDDMERRNCYKRKGFCGCILTIRNANDTHSGIWNWEMEFEGTQKVRSLAPISVQDSYLISEIEQPNYENGEKNFKFNCRPLPTMHYRKIRYCKWFDSKNHQISTDNSTKYKEIMENNYCSLELKVSYRKDLDVWKCVAGLDESSEEKIYATFDLSKMSFNFSKEEPNGKIGERDGFPLKSPDNATKNLPEASDIPPGLSQRKISDEKLEKSPETFDIRTLIAVIAIIISIVSFCLAIRYCVYNKMQMRKKIREAQAIKKLLVEIKQGPLDPGTMLNEQLDYIRYNEDRWEYPCGKLKILKVLGKGNFGVVHKAMAENIKKDGEKTKVAIKQILTTSFNDVRALVYELKILSSLTEKHPHIVNLLGACTRDVPKESGGLWVILEYCRCGNLHDFLEKNKSEFVSQSERIIVGQIDLRAPGQINHSNPDDSKQSESGFVCKLDDEGGRETSRLSICSDDSHEVAYADENSSRQQPRAFSTGDLMLWGLHVASGMQFLSKNKILHGDLAARNVLLTHNRMAKICDFGLARSIPDGYYQNQINNEKPFKYLAMESLKYGKYSTKTDVWSFGIFLWECFSLGKTPYEELFTSQSILEFLSSDKRLDKPIHSTDDFHQMMLLCWKKEARDRPTFAELVQKINVSIEKATNGSDYENANDFIDISIMTHCLRDRER